MTPGQRARKVIQAEPGPIIPLRLLQAPEQPTIQLQETQRWTKAAWVGMMLIDRTGIYRMVRIKNKIVLPGAKSANSVIIGHGFSRKLTDCPLFQYEDARFLFLIRVDSRPISGRQLF